LEGTSGFGGLDKQMTPLRLQATECKQMTEAMNFGFWIVDWFGSHRVTRNTQLASRNPQPATRNSQPVFPKIHNPHS